jgi:hypothetical protein
MTKRQSLRERRWQAFQCSLCNRVVSYPPAPAGPGKPLCQYGHAPAAMFPVEVTPVGEATGCTCQIGNGPRGATTTSRRCAVHGGER